MIPKKSVRQDGFKGIVLTTGNILPGRKGDDWKEYKVAGAQSLLVTHRRSPASMPLAFSPLRLHWLCGSASVIGEPPKLVGLMLAFFETKPKPRQTLGTWPVFNQNHMGEEKGSQPKHAETNKRLVSKFLD